MLDRTDLVGRLFFPRVDETKKPASAEDHFIEVPGARLHLRVHEGKPGAGVVLLFHGNGEIVSDWNPAAGSFRSRGYRLAIVDYRGYGLSTGTPTIRTMLSDASLVLDDVATRFEGPLVVMGRSLGSASAWEAMANARETGRVRGVVIDSGFVDVEAFGKRRGVEPRDLEAEDRLALDPLPKLAAVTCPVLLLHGELDAAIRIEEAATAYAALQTDKRLIRLAGKDHNDLSYHPDYWSELGVFITQKVVR